MKLRSINCRSILSVVILLFVTAITQLTEWLHHAAAAQEPGIFRRPALVEASHKLQRRSVGLAQAGQMAAALQTCQEAVRLAPFSAVAQYNLGCLFAKNGDLDEALKKLKLAIELGFRDANIFMNDPDLLPMKDRPEFVGLLEEVKKPLEAPKPKLSPFEDAVGWVGPENTIWDEASNLLMTGFEWKPFTRPRAVIVANGEVVNRLKRWFSQGTAAGHFGDLYDNCDRDHSNLNYAQFPQLHRIEYRPEISADVPFGLQNRFIHGGVVIGNSSTARTDANLWRSNPRVAYTTPASTATLVRQYFLNHLYVYPEHRDHDPGHNGEGGFGDVYPTNTPYLLITQGSSGSDQALLNPLACTLAAFQPDVKQRIVENGAMTPTLQQIVRTSSKLVKSLDDYLSGLAHPSVFEGSNVDPVKMIEEAHAMTFETIPPLVRIRVEQQDRAMVGRDYFETNDREILFDSPCAIARIGRSTQYKRHMIVSARDSLDLEKRPMKFRWVILRGDASRIALKPLDEEGSRAEIMVAWHPRQKIRPDSEVESNRVDIGVFAFNGVNWSAPAFVTWYFLDNEDREYDDQGRILSVSYHGGTDQGNYTDPLIQTPKTWKDTYRYTDDGRLIGWTRTRGTGADQTTEQFTPEGGLVIEQDQLGRAAAVRAPLYLAQKVEGKPLPILVQKLNDDVYRYRYDHPEDLIGKIVSREKLPPEKSTP